MPETTAIHGIDNSPRGRLLSAAAHLFRDKGFDRTTVRDIAAAVGIQSGSIFHHFKSKEDILYQYLMPALTLSQLISLDRYPQMKVAIT